MPFVWGNPGWVAGSPATPPLESTADRQAWTDFLDGGGGALRTGRQLLGQRLPPAVRTNATPLPIQSWQIWNEPNLAKFFAPSPSPGKYAQLLRISHDAIKSQDPQARIVLAGMLAYPNPKAWDFLDELYDVGNVKGSFDAAALHPYASEIDRVQNAFQQFRRVMNGAQRRADPALGHRDRLGVEPSRPGRNQQGPRGSGEDAEEVLPDGPQQPWRLERAAPLLVFLARSGHPHAGHLQLLQQRGALAAQPHPEARLRHLPWLHRRDHPPQASITSGPSQGSSTNDSTPSFSFASDEPGSTFVCRVDGGAFKPCSSPHTLPALADGTHTFSVRAIDAPGNESTIVSRYFTVDTQAPATPQITSFAPNSPANDNNPEVKGSSAAGTTVKLYKTAGCAGTQVAQGNAAKFASPGITVSVADNTTTSFRAKAIDAAGNVSPCSSGFTYVEDSTAPETTITSGPPILTTNDRPTFRFASSEASSTFRCRFDSQPFAICSGPGASHRPATPLSNGSHTFYVRATDKANNTDPTPANLTFTVAP